MFWPDDWSAVLGPSAPVAELVLRGLVIYFFLFTILRVVGRRLFTRLAMSDVLVMLLIAVAVRDGITGGHRTLADAAISVATILACDLLVDRLAYSVPALRRPLRHEPVKIVEDGNILVDRARDNLLTRTEIMQQVHAQGLTSLAQVGAAWMEPDGQFTVVPRTGVGGG